MQDRPTFGVLSNQGLGHLCSVANTTESFSETKFRKKNQHFLVYGKTPIIQFSYMEKCLSQRFHTMFCTYGIVWNCMTRSFS